MAVDSLVALANNAAEVLERKDRSNPNKTVAVPDSERRQTMCPKEAVKNVKLNDRSGIEKHLYNIMDTGGRSTFHENLQSDTASDSELDESLDKYCLYDYDLKSSRRKTAKFRRTKRERTSTKTKEQKFIDYCRETESPSNITLEKRGRKTIRVKFCACSRQMLRDKNCREQNLERKANIEKKLRKRGLKRLAECVRTNWNQDNKAAEKYALREGNAPNEMKDILDFLLGLQDREITPEDYEILLRLDESVPTKTVSKDRLTSLKEDNACEEHVEEICGICMENYEVGQTRKVLPCGHAFHTNCIDTWLGQSSTKCPLDGMEI